MPTSRIYTLSNVSLFLFWKSRQLAIMDKSLSGDTRIPDAYIMRHPNDAMSYVKLWTSGTGSTTQLQMDVTDSLPSDYSGTNSNSYAFNNTEGALWLAGNQIVVGTGDVRDLTSGIIYKHALGDSESNALILTCTADFALKVYWKSSGRSSYSLGNIAVNPN